MKHTLLLITALLALAGQTFPSPFGEKTRPTSTGDIVFADGTATAWRKGLTLTDEQKKAAVAVIFYAGGSGDTLGERMLGVGLRNATGSDNALTWARFTSDTDKAEGYEASIDGILCAPSRKSSAETATFTGDTDGRDNWAVLRAAVGDGEREGNYPAWEWAASYAKSNGLAGEFADGWYLPTVAELCMLYRAKDTVNAALECAGGTKLTDSGSYAEYWSSSQSPRDDDHAWAVWFGDAFIFKSGDVGSSTKHGDSSVCAIRDFGGENAAADGGRRLEQIAAEVREVVAEEDRRENELQRAREREHKTLVEQGLSLISLMKEKAGSDVYARLLGMSEGVIAKIRDLRAFDVSKVSDIARVSGVFDVYGLDEAVTRRLSPALKREIEILLLKSFSGNWSKNADRDEIGAASIIASEKTFVCPELTEDCIYIFCFDGGTYPAAVSFVRGEGDSVTAFACFVLNERFVADVLAAAMSDSGLQWEWVQ